MKRATRVVVVAVLAVALFVAGGIGIFRSAGSSSGSRTGTAAHPAKDVPVILTGSLTQTIASLQAHLRGEPHDWRSWAELGEAYVQQARVTADPSYYPKADGALQRSLALNQTENLDAMTGMAALAAARHDFAGALRWGQRGETLNQYNANIHAIAGDALVELGRYRDAFAEFQKAVDLRPDLSTYARASYALELQGNVRDATRAMDLALQAASSPSDRAWASNQLGELAWAGGDLDRAERYYRRAEQFDPTFIPPHAGVAKVEAARGRTVRAIADYRWVVARYPLPEYVVALGDLYSKSGQAGQADQEYGLLHVEERLFQANGVNMDLEVALFDADHGTDLSAGLAAAQAEYRRRQSIAVADALAWELYANGRYQDALTYAIQAVHLGTKSAPFSFHKGMIEAALGQSGPAREDLQRAIDINPAFSVLWPLQAKKTLQALRAAS